MKKEYVYTNEHHPDYEVRAVEGSNVYRVLYQHQEVDVFTDYGTHDLAAWNFFQELEVTK